MQITSKRLHVGWYVFRDGSIYRVVEINTGSGAITLRDHHTGLVLACNGADLFTGEETPCLYAATLSALQDEIARQQPLAKAFVMATDYRRHSWIKQSSSSRLWNRSNSALRHAV